MADAFPPTGSGQAVLAGISEPRRRAGKLLIWAGSLLLALVLVLQVLNGTGLLDLGLETWRPALYAFVAWAVALCTGIALMRGEAGMHTLFVLPAFLFTLVMVIFP